MNDRKYRILHFRKEFERNLPVFINIVKGIDNDRFDHIICYLGKNHGLNDTLADSAYEVLYLGFQKKSLGFFNPRVIFRLAKILKEKKIDIIHCQKHKPTVYGTLAVLISGGMSVITHVHGLFRTRSAKRRFFNWIILRFVKRVIAVSDSVRSDIIKSNWNIDPAKVVTVKNCINLGTIDSISTGRRDARLKLGIPEDETVFGTVGRLVATKGQTYLIDAFQAVMKKIPNSRLVIIGDGSLSQKLQKQVEESGISSRVLFTGYRKDVLELLMGFDVFVLPSLAEGLSIALLEAMASRLPVIASDVGGIPEVFGNSYCGRLVPPKDVAALSAAMVEIGLLDNTQKKRLGEEGRKKIEEEFTADVMIRKIQEVYESVLKGDE
jgi:glycosyltransferase involved in cell wall biosynthesis